ncbi:PTS sugar transporter subunit IIA [Enterococcus sp.]|uniref:PTS sugar transporter subunit IIA n=1 Tax=Enterococcus sp. TaxID=35783 RepID=UPI00290DD7D4|nr:PTS sugar transporter subunit IIA [Enterococcus sp.]MDU5334988.1 PTS sugar transporter subunit IIA [Enterococcus sp.]
MKKILIATHGHLASGYLSSIQLLAGTTEGIAVINAYVDENDFDQELQQFVNHINEKDQVFVFSDLFGGSVNQKVTRIFLEQKISATVIAGFNLPIVLEILLASEELSQESIRQMVEKCQKEMRVNILKEEVLVNDEEDFF